MREVKSLAQSHTAFEQQRWNLNPYLWDSQGQNLFNPSAASGSGMSQEAGLGAEREDLSELPFAASCLCLTHHLFPTHAFPLALSHPTAAQGLGEHLTFKTLCSHVYWICTDGQKGEVIQKDPSTNAG